MDMENEIKKIHETLKNKVSTQMMSEFRKDMESRLSEIGEDVNRRFGDIAKSVEDIKREVETTKDEIRKLHGIVDDLKDSLEILREYTLKYEKFLKKVRYIEEVIGVEEEINVSKVPPNILQLVYQYTLNDIINNMKKYVGVDEAERIVNNVLQDVRTRTSGTELFKFRNGKIITKDIEKAIERKLISPKQVHSTYVEIVNKLREYIPQYIPKNFASLLRTKGQEYAIETTTENRIRIEMIERSMEKLRNELSYQENMWRDELMKERMDVDEKITDVAEGLNKRIEDISEHLQGIKDEVSKIYDFLMRITPYLEVYRLSLYDKILNEIPVEGMKMEGMKYPKEIISDFVEFAKNSGLILLYEDLIFSWEKVKNHVINQIEEGESISFSELRKRTGYERELLMSILERLVEEGFLEEKKYGKGKKYRRR